MSRFELDEAWRLHRAGEHDRAEKLYLNVIRADPRNYEAHHRLAFLHGQRGRWEDAERVMARAIELNPGAADALFLRGAALQKLHRHEEAAGCFGRALALNPGFAEALLNRAASLYRLRRYEDAGDDYSRLIEIDPDYPFARGNRLFCRLQTCDWRSLAGESAAIVEAMKAGRRVIAPFDAKALFLTPEDELACARIWAADQHPGPSPVCTPQRHSRPAIRVAYVSADFREGPLATLMTSVFERHDQHKIETIGVSLGADDGSAARHRLQKAFGRFIDLHDKSDAEITSLLRQMQIDIAVDLMGYTEGGRPGIFKQRPAPIQVNYLGCPGTVGADWLDYLIADRAVVPEGERHFYSEKLVYLPDTYLPRDTACRPSAVRPTRADEGLPETGFVFASFNNTYKLNPVMFDIWMRLLRAVEGSVLWLPASNPAAMGILTREAIARGVAPERIVFARFKKESEHHLARVQLADLFLDTLPYNAHTTASDALWAGVPVLTCVGKTFAGRVAASLLRSLELPDLITETLADYEAAALRLAADPEALGAIRQTLERHRMARPTFDEARFARHLETAFRSMWERWRRGDAPESFRVPALESEVP